MKTTGVIIARFQTPYLHDGHKGLIDEIQAAHNKVVIVLGISAAATSKRNPFDFYTREKMLRQYAPHIVVLPLADNTSDKVWSENLDNLLLNTFSAENFVLYGSRDSFIPFYSGKLSTKELASSSQHSSTTVRYNEGDRVLDSLDFRLGVNYAVQNAYPSVYATVDVAVLGLNNTQLLLGRKHGANQWRLPGGFSDPTDGSFEEAAKRELSEECGSFETGKMQYIASAKIDDWRYRKEENKIITLLFATTHVYGTPQAGDDLAEVKWFAIDQLPKMMEEKQITAEHSQLIQLLNTHLSTQK